MANRIKLKGTTERSFDIGLSNKQTFDATNLTANRTWILPDSAGSNGQVLSTDGAGNLSWATAIANAAGSNNQIQYNANGAFAASSAFTFNPVFQELSIGNSIANAAIFLSDGNGTVGMTLLSGAGNAVITSSTQGNLRVTGANSAIAPFPGSTVFLTGGNGSLANPPFGAGQGGNATILAGTHGNGNSSGFVNLGTFGGNITLAPNGAIRVNGSYGNIGQVLTVGTSNVVGWANATGGGGNVLINTQPIIEFTANTTANNQVFSNANIGNFISNVYATVYVNGVLQQPSDYVISGSNLTINTQINSGDDIIVGPTYSGIAAGSNTQIQFNDGGALGADADFTYDKVTNTMTVGNIASVDSITFDTAAVTTSAVARITWDDGYGMLQYGVKGGNYDVKIGEDLATLCYNGTGNTIAKGKVVYIAGAQGQRISVGLADNSSDTTSARTFGFVAENFPNGEEKFVVTQGMLRNIDTSAYAPGTILWLGTNGNFTSTKPVAPAHLVFVGVVLKQNAASGEVYVKPQNGYELDELHDIKITTPVANSSILQYDSANSLWINQTTAQFRSSANIGNIANINLNGNSSTYLNGNGTFSAPSGGGGETFNQFMLMGA